eukprot:Skav228324  [mRNA]  locus=scaffold4117:223904:224329:- [translate_table: standard]
MASSLGDTHSCHLLIFNCSQSEGQDRKAFLHFRDELPGLLCLQAVHVLHSSLVDGVSDLRLLAFAFTGGHDNVNAIDLVQLKLEFLHLLLSGLCANDGAVSINHVLLELMRKNTLHGFHLEVFSNLGKRFSDLGVLVANLN